MKKIILAIIVLSAIINQSYCQDWVPVINKTVDNGIRRIYNDTVTGDLIFAGDFTIFDSIPAYSIAALHNNVVDTFRRGLKHFRFNYGAHCTEVTRYHNNIYAAGDFDTDIYGPDTINSLARWDGTNWNPVLNVSESQTIFNLNVIGDTLFMSGVFDTINNQYCSGVLAYVEGQGVVKCYGGFYKENNFITSIIKYNNQLYVYGLIIDTTAELAIGRWNGAYWERVGEAFQHDLGAEVMDAIEYQGDLYVCGSFIQADGNAGDNIMRWDGNQWYDVGGGLDYQAYTMEVHDGLLYVGGQFSYAGGIQTGNVAVWDGNQWYSITHDVFTNDGISDLTFYNNELYVVGGFTKIGSDSIRFIAKYNGVLNDVEDKIKSSIKITVYPNPTTTNLQLTNLPHKQLNYAIINVLGQVKQSGSLAPNNAPAGINVTTLPAGVYFIRLIGGNGFTGSGKFVKE